MVKSMVKSCLPELSDFTRVFSPVRVLCNRPMVYLNINALYIAIHSLSEKN